MVLARDRIVWSAVETLALSQDEVLFNPIGDGLYIALLTPPDRFDIHLQLALEILRKLSEHNQQMGGAQQFQLRIGIDECPDNLIKDINGRPNVAGVGANMGSRIMDLADGGQILVSHVVHNHLHMRQQYEGKFRELPVAEVKHGIKVKAFQYTDETALGLNCELPGKSRDATGPVEIAMDINRPPAVLQRNDESAAEQASKDVLISEDSETKSTTSEQQISNALAAALQIVGQPEYASGLRFSGDISDFFLLRLQLFVTTWLQDQLPSAMLGSHECNRLYLNRAELQVTRPELFSILRMLINDSAGYIPGWFWLRTFDPAIVERVILHFALSDPLAFIRQQAFEILNTAVVPLPEEVEQQMALTITADASPEVRRAAAKYLGHIGKERHLPIIGSALVDNEAGVRYEAERSKYLILARSTPARAFKELLNASGFDVTEILKELEPGKTAIDSATLAQALDHTDSEIRLFAVHALAVTGQLSREQAMALKKDKSETVKVEAYRFLIAHGTELRPADLALDLPDDRLGRWMSRNLSARPGMAFDTEPMILEFYRRYGTDELLEMAAWQNWSGHTAYRALAVEHFDIFGDKVREDLRTDFTEEAAPFFDQELAKQREIEAKQALHPEKFTPVFSLFSPTRKFTPEELAQSSVEGRKTEYLTAALAGIARNGRQDDVQFGRNYLFHSDTDLRIEAVKIVNRFGTADDVDNLIKVATTDDGLLQELAAMGALRLAPDHLTVAAAFLQTANEILVSMTIAELIKHNNTEMNSEFLTPYLNDQRDAIRNRVMLFFTTVLEKEELQELLTRYTVGETYYYDVVCCFDRKLYAPPRLANSYIGRLRELFFGLLD